MCYYSETGYDGIRNLLNVIKACVLPIPPGMGVMLLMTDRIFNAKEDFHAENTHKKRGGNSHHR